MFYNYRWLMDDLGINEDQEKGLKYFFENLSHGSGIDCDWTGYTTKNGDYVYITNSYHCMDDVGYYDGYQDFSIVILKTDFLRLVDFYNKYSVYQHVPSKNGYKDLFNAVLEMIRCDFKLQFNNGQYKADRYMLRDYLEDTIVWNLEEMKLE